MYFFHNTLFQIWLLVIIYLKAISNQKYSPGGIGTSICLLSRQSRQTVSHNQARDPQVIAQQLLLKWVRPWRLKAYILESSRLKTVMSSHCAIKKLWGTLCDREDGWPEQNIFFPEILFNCSETRGSPIVCRAYSELLFQICFEN